MRGLFNAAKPSSTPLDVAQMGQVIQLAVREGVADGLKNLPQGAVSGGPQVPGVRGPGVVEVDAELGSAIFEGTLESNLDDIPVDSSIVEGVDESVARLKRLREQAGGGAE